MRFCGRPFGVNMTEIRVYEDRELRQRRLCAGGRLAEDLGKNLRTVSGGGEFETENAAEEIEMMRSLFNKGDRGMLVMPQYPPIYAVLDSLTFYCKSDGGGGYKFLFREIDSEDLQESLEVKHRARSGESLWSIAALYGLPVETLVGLNPWAARPDRELEENTEVTVLWR